MLRSLLFLPALAVASPVLAQTASVPQPTPASASADRGAIELIERDWVLMNWALKEHDENRDILLSPAEAQAAAGEFRRIADADGDGRVTPQEYRAARAFVLARY